MSFDASIPFCATAVLALADGSVFRGRGLGAPGMTGGELCFNTSMTGYQEIVTDPSYAGQIITFTFPHVGNVGVNGEDHESATPFARGLVLKADITSPSSHRAEGHFNDWLKRNALTGICGVDTRALTAHLRERGAQNAIISHDPCGVFDLDGLRARACALPDMTGCDLAREVSCKKPYSIPAAGAERGHVAVLDYGVKRNILNCLSARGFRLTVLPCTATAEDVLSLGPDGVFLSNGPGDPAATGAYAVPVIRRLLAAGLPLFGICLGHQMLAIALGGRTAKLPFGHRGANHPVKNMATGRIEITSQNHGFHVVPESLPEAVEVTHVSLFDGTNEGLCLKGQPVFSVQYHPEASPGPHDSHYLFTQFADHVSTHKSQPQRKTA